MVKKGVKRYIKYFRIKYFGILQDLHVDLLSYTVTNFWKPRGTIQEKGKRRIKAMKEKYVGC